MIGVAVFDRSLERCGERDRRIEMKTIHARSGSCRALTDDRRTVQQVRERMVFEAPGAEEVVFRAGSADGGFLCPVNEEHVVALAPPVILVLQDGHGHYRIL